MFRFLAYITSIGMLCEAVKAAPQQWAEPLSLARRQLVQAQSPYSVNISVAYLTLNAESAAAPDNARDPCNAICQPWTAAIGLCEKPYGVTNASTECLCRNETFTLAGNCSICLQQTGDYNLMLRGCIQTDPNFVLSGKTIEVNSTPSTNTTNPRGKGLVASKATALMPTFNVAFISTGLATLMIGLGLLF